MPRPKASTARSRRLSRWLAGFATASTTELRSTSTAAGWICTLGRMQPLHDHPIHKMLGAPTGNPEAAYKDRGIYGQWGAQHGPPTTEVRGNSQTVCQPCGRFMALGQAKGCKNPV